SILKELAKRPDLSLLFVLKFIVLVIPISLSVAVPFSFLAAIMLTFGRLSADSEFVSMRMAGLSMGRICAPVAVIAVFFTLICGWINVSITPAAKTEMEGMKASLFNLVQREPLLLFPQEGVMSELPGHLIYAKKEDGILKGLQIIRMENNVPQAIAVAREAKVRVDLEAENPELVLEMTDVNLMVSAEDGNFMDSSQPLFMESASAGFSIDMFKEAGTKMKERPQNLPMRTLLKNSKNPEVEPKLRKIYRNELSRRFAFSTSCITLALIGIPLAITSQRRETGAGFIMSLGIGMGYYTLQSVVRGLGDRDEIYPHIIAWMPNLLFLILGAMMFRKLSRK
ncbi:MAG: LptF/LptG family permease, partial [Verrucomicrobiales bacterium]